jgi:AraC-like DNA-binding protein
VPKERTTGSFLDQQRRALASRYLGEGHTVAEVALLLGFAHPSTFSAAFKRWTGKTPRHVKRARPPLRGPTGEKR